MYSISLCGLELGGMVLDKNGYIYRYKKRLLKNKLKDKGNVEAQGKIVGTLKEALKENNSTKLVNK